MKELEISIEGDVSLDVRKQHRKDLEEYMKHLTPKAQKNLEIVESTDVNPFMLRIDNVVPKFFTPLLPLSSAELKFEDRSVPRVCVAHDLVSCILGIARLHKEFLDNNVPDDKNKKGNIYHISALPYILAVKPNDKLLYDVDLTNEHWLIGYNKDNQKFYPISVGKLFITNLNVTYKEHNNHKPLMYMECFIHISSDKGIMIKPGKKVERGYYKLLIEKDNNGKLRLGEIEKADFNQMKRIVVSIENFKESLIDKW